MATVVVVGGGLAGLVAAHTLLDQGVEPLVLEAAPRAGGMVASDAVAGYVFEQGPATIMLPEDSALKRAITKAHLLGELLHPLPSAKKRFVLRRGKLRAVPKELWKLLPLEGLVRLGLEGLLPGRRRRRGQPPLPPETLMGFARRRFGVAAAHLLFDPLCSGIYAGDPERLELASAMPTLAAMEQEHGSVIRAVLKGGMSKRQIVGLRRGLGSLTDALARELGPRLRTETPVTGLSQPAVPGTGSWVVQAGQGEDSEEHRAEAVILATPSYVSARLTRPFAPDLAGWLDEIPYAPAVVITLCYPEAAFRDGPPEGFGFLIPHKEKKLMLGCQFPSSIFVGQAPAGFVQLRVICGGRRNPSAVELDDATLTARVRAELEPIVGAADPPSHVQIYRWPLAIPQYELGHQARVQRIEARLGQPDLDGLYLTGNPYRGVSVPDVAKDGEAIARAVAAGLPTVTPVP